LAPRATAPDGSPVQRGDMTRSATGRRSLVARSLSELAVIVTGVLLALWADSWVDERAERRVEASRIEALRDNVAATRERLGRALADAESASHALRTVAYWESLPILEEASEGVLLEALLFGPSFTPEINVYVDLKSSGELGLLRSARLRQSLAGMDATLEQLQLLQHDLITVQQLNFDRYVLETLALDRGFAE